MKRIAVFAGSFDPITKGHQDLVERALPMFDELIIAIGNNGSKNRMFTLDQRLNFIKQIVVTNPKIKVDTYEGLTTDYCQSVDARFLLRGIRNTLDFEYERSIAQANKKLAPNVETVFLITSENTSYISSSIVRDVLKNNGDASHFLPEGLKI